MQGRSTKARRPLEDAQAPRPLRDGFAESRGILGKSPPLTPPLLLGSSHDPKLWYLQCSLWSTTRGIPWALVGNVNSQALPVPLTRNWCFIKMPAAGGWGFLSTLCLSRIHLQPPARLAPAYPCGLMSSQTVLLCSGFILSSLPPSCSLVSAS